MLSDPDPVAEGFGGIGGKAGVIDLATDGFQPRKLEKGTDISNTSSRQEEGLTKVLGRVGDAVKDTSNMTHAKEPQFRRGTSPVHEPVDGGLKSLASAFEEVLMLMTRFTSPKPDPKEFETIRQFSAGVIARMVAEETIGGSPSLNEGLNCAEEAFGAGNGFDVCPASRAGSSE